MSVLPRIATHLGPFGSGADRYNLKGYNLALSPEERIRRAATVRGLDAVELNLRGLVTEETAPTVKALLDEVGLACANVSLNVWGDPLWTMGSLSNPDRAVREQAINLIVNGMETARALGSNLASLWPGQDGFDYPFQVNYADAVDWFVEGLHVCADAVPDVRLCIEYKPKEPRTHLLFDTAARTLWILGKANRPNLGVLLDVGHSLFAGENVAQAAALLQREAMLDLIHFNDNYGEWDWDMVPGTVRFWELLELIFWLRETGYRGYYSIDIATRGDPVRAVQQSVTNIQRLYRLTEKLDRERVLANLRGAEPMANLALVSDQVFAVLEG